jgi:3-phenylpropionate/trans-cinnamate dioxygenase beta subunit/p-cumate 2,3-dioxygenase beta subunit
MKVTQRSFETRYLVEEFLFREAHLLDSWLLDDWLQLLDDDFSYFVPATDVRSNYTHSLGIISDDGHRIKQRVSQLLGNEVWCENPRSRTRRLISNVVVVSEQETCIEVRANFIIYRFGNSRTDTFVGSYEYKLIPQVAGFKISSRIARLDHESLLEHGKISIIL